MFCYKEIKCHCYYENYHLWQEPTISNRRILVPVNFSNYQSTPSCIVKLFDNDVYESINATSWDDDWTKHNSITVGRLALSTISRSSLSAIARSYEQISPVSNCYPISSIVAVAIILLAFICITIIRTCSTLVATLQLLRCFHSLLKKVTVISPGWCLVLLMTPV